MFGNVDAVVLTPLLCQLVCTKCSHMNRIIRICQNIHSDYQVDQVRENKFTGWRGLRGTGDKFWPMQS